MFLQEITPVDGNLGCGNVKSFAHKFFHTKFSEVRSNNVWFVHPRESKSPTDSSGRMKLLIISLGNLSKANMTVLAMIGGYK
jgi:hypothetical protein